MKTARGMKKSDILVVNVSGRGDKDMGILQEELQRVIPPGTLVRRRSDGRQFRIGYYSPNDGLDCIWLVDRRGDYAETTDHQDLHVSFDIIQRNTESDLFGEHREPLGPLPRKKR